jgi:glutamine---fructose-6-phosphate transaminase (isomerizing)
MAGEHTHSEIVSQPETWTQVLSSFDPDGMRAFLETHATRPLLFTGCGSAYYTSLTAAALAHHPLRRAYASPASEIALYPETIFRSGFHPILIAISRSGETTETAAAVAQARQSFEIAGVLVVTCSPTSTLAQMADIVLSAQAAKEKSIVQTRSLTSMMLLTTSTISILREQEEPWEQLPEACERLLNDYTPLAQELAEQSGIQRFFFLGSGSMYGIAQECALKMQEMSLAQSAAYHTLEFRHGPSALADSGALVVGLISEKTADHELSVLYDMEAQGARILAITEYPINDFPGHQVILDSAAGECMRPALYLPFVQLLGYYRAIVSGQNPDLPRYLRSHVHLENL